MVERAEEMVRRHGFRIFRVRFLVNSLGDPMARLQVDPAELDRVPSHWPEICCAFVKIGFSNADWDPAGYRSPARMIIDDHEDFNG
jgi:uncharacterized protein